MSKSYKSRWSIWIICFFILANCTPDTAKKNMLLGKWQVINAERNGAPTTTLENAFFDFNSDSTLVTNILRREMTISYYREENKIIQKKPINITYQIDVELQDSMVFSTKIGNYDFIFYLTRDTIKELESE